MGNLASLRRLWRRAGEGRFVLSIPGCVAYERPVAFQRSFISVQPDQDLRRLQSKIRTLADPRCIEGRIFGALAWKNPNNRGLSSNSPKENEGTRNPASGGESHTRSRWHMALPRYTSLKVRVRHRSQTTVGLSVGLETGY